MSNLDQLLDILVCPETKEPVHRAEPSLIEAINSAISKGTAKQRDGETVSESIDDGLLREDGKFLYPVRQDIPIMLIDEAIDMATVPAANR